MRTQPYRPAADVQAELEVVGGAIEDPERLLSVMVTNYDEDAAPKRSVPARRDRPLLESQELRVTPQPASDRVTISYFPDGSTQYDCLVTSLLGEEVMHVSGPAGEGVGHITLDVRSLPAGVYLYKLSSERGLHHGRFIVAK